MKGLIINNDFFDKSIQPFPEREAKRTFSRIGLGFLAYILVSNLAVVIVYLIANRFAPELSENAIFRVLSSFLPLYIAGIPVLWLILKKIPTVSPVRHRMSANRFFKIFIMSVSAVYILNCLSLVFMYYLQSRIGKSFQNPIDTLLSNVPWYINFTITVIAAPIFEELMFRKFVIDRTLKYGEITSVLISSLLFSLMHHNLYQIFYAFGLGFIFGIVYLKTGKLRHTIALHMGINIIGGVISMVILKLLNLEALMKILSDNNLSEKELYARISEYITNNPLNIILLSLYEIFLFTLIIWGFVMLVRRMSRFSKEIGPSLLPEGKKLEITMLNAGMVLFVLVTVVMTYMSLIVTVV